MDNVPATIYSIGYILTFVLYWADVLDHIDSLGEAVIVFAGSQLAAMVWPVYWIIELVMG